MTDTDGKGGGLGPSDHNGGVGGFLYVYPVVSRRAGGVSIGVNLNPNKACNYRCLYCQVEGLSRGKGPAIDVALLRDELHAMLEWLQRGDFYERWVPEPARSLRDVAFSGDGEPTSGPDFAPAAEAVLDVLAARGLATLPVVLISNGTLLHKATAQRGLRLLGAGSGRLWFKLDAGRDADLRRIHDSAVSLATLRRNLRLAAPLLPTWIQTCAFGLDGEAPTEAWATAWLAALQGELSAGTPLQGVLLYSVARRSYQPEAPRLQQMSAEWLESLAVRVRALGLDCEAHP